VALECVKNALGEPGADGRRRPVPVAGSEFQIEADAVVTAIGQVPDVAFLDGSVVSLHTNKTVVVDPETGLAGGERVYAGGDAVRGPATIIEACVDGRRAAEAICRQLGVAFDLPAVQFPVLSEEEIVQVKRVRTMKVSQSERETLSLEQRGDFDLVEATLTEETALAEAARCVQCSTFCDKCVEVCPNRANYTVAVSPASLTLPTLSCQQGRLEMMGEDVFRVEQGRQIIHVDDFCNECGNCATFCVHDGKPYQDKPRLFLTEGDFELETDNAFYVVRDAEKWIVRRREGGKESRVSLDGSTGEMSFESEVLKLDVSPDFQVQAMELKQEFEGVFSLTGLAETYVILKGIDASLCFLPRQAS
jgi:putative selenate reductase